MCTPSNPIVVLKAPGFPDYWTQIGEVTGSESWIDGDGRDSKGRKQKTSDAARYKALDNSIALLFWFWLLRRISAQYERPATLGSLFDVPLC